jgi:hypothetical protein
MSSKQKCVTSKKPEVGAVGVPSVASTHMSDNNNPSFETDKVFVLLALVPWSSNPDNHQEAAASRLQREQ